MCNLGLVSSACTPLPEQDVNAHLKMLTFSIKISSSLENIHASNLLFCFCFVKTIMENSWHIQKKKEKDLSIREYTVIKKGNKDAIDVSYYSLKA